MTERCLCDTGENTARAWVWAANGFTLVQGTLEPLKYIELVSFTG